MKCPGCGAAMSSAMVTKGECGYCGSALPKDAATGTADLAKAIEKLAEQPRPVVHRTTIEVRGPDVHVGGIVGGIFDSLTARIAGCFTGCLSMGVTLVVTAMILGFTGWQIWASQKNLPHPSPPRVEQPKPGKRR